MKIFNAMARFVCFFVILFFFIDSCTGYISYGDSGQKLIEKFGVKEAGDDKAFVYEEGIKPYQEALKEYKEKGLYEKIILDDIVLDNQKINISGGNIEDVVKEREDGTDSKCIYWENSLEWVEWDVEVKAEGLYELEIEYMAVSSSTRMDIERSIYIDGKIPFKEAGNIILPRLWREAGEPQLNHVGDEIWPKQEEVIRWNSIAIYDKMAMYSEPLKFYLSEGSHKIRIVHVSEPVILGDVKLRSIKKFYNYEEYISQYADMSISEYEGEDITVEAEDNVIEKNNLTVRRESDSDPATSPISRGARRLNVYGGWRWREGYQSITWEFEVPRDGLYNIGIKVLQTHGKGLPVYRRIEIDGEVPFDGLNEYTFLYNKKWQMVVLGDENKDYWFYLKKGKHTITMTATMGKVGELSLSLEKDCILLSDILQKVFMLTGSEPDPNFDYEFERNIPGMVPEMEGIINNLQYYLNTLDEICTKRPEVYSLISRAKKTMEEFISDRYKMAARVNDLRDIQEILTSVYYDLRYSSLTIDYFKIGSKDNKWYSGINSNIFQQIYTTLYNFIRSFVVDYNAISGMLDSETGEKEYEVLNIWMGMGIEWAEIIKNMADELFTPETGIVLNVNLVPASSFQTQSGGVNVLLLALASGNSPHMASEVHASVPVELAIRDALVNLEEFSDFNEVAMRFLPETLVPLQYRGATYAIPETMGLQLLFYRKDILQELGIKVPETWDELCQEVLPVLYRNNLNFSYPPDFSTFLYQYGGRFFTDDGLKSELDSTEAFKAFKDFTFLYSGYGVDPVNQSFYQKFRTGETPMGIDNQTMYMNFLCAAPELTGKWGVAPIPGTRKENGVIDRSTGNMLLGQKTVINYGITDLTAMIFKNSPKVQQNAWEFIKWLTSDEIQIRFCRELEANMTKISRWFTANTAAYKQLGWDPEHLEAMTEQWAWYRGIPVVLGSYFVPRHLNNAWTDVILGDKLPRDSLELAVKEINLEMKRKQEEYGVYAGN